MFTLAADGKVNRKGMPNPLRLAVIATHHFGDVRLPFPPAWLQRLGLALGAPLGRLLGFEATYTPEAPWHPPPWASDGNRLRGEALRAGGALRPAGKREGRRWEPATFSSGSTPDVDIRARPG